MGINRRCTDVEVTKFEIIESCYYPILDKMGRAIAKKSPA
jgi:hypothetical protein